MAFEEILENISDLVFYGHRLSSFSGKWQYDEKSEAQCTSEKLARAGFYYTGSASDFSAATCAFCLKEMNFDPEDDPWVEHTNRDKMGCQFVKISKQDESELTMGDLFLLMAYRQTRLVVDVGMKQLDTLEAAMLDVTENMKVPSK